MPTLHNRTAGFTLVEILIVVIIIMVLFALLLPGIWNQYQRFRSDQARISIEKLQGELLRYHADHNRYPTNAEGLFALLFIPDNVGVTPAIQQPGNMMPGMDNSSMMGGSQSIGPDLLNQPNSMGVGNSGGVGMNPMSPMNMPAQGGMDPMNPMTMDPMNPAGGLNSGAVPTTGAVLTNEWTAWIHNEQLFTQRRQRPTPYIRSERELQDPWGNPYRYDSSLTFYGVNQFTGRVNPAIWSAGPDGIDNTDDDIRSWDPEEAQELLTQRQWQMQMQQQQGGMMDGSMGVGGMGGTMMPNNMMQTQGAGGFGMPQQGGMMGMPPQGGTGMPPQGGMMGMPPQGGAGMPPQGGMMGMPPQGGMGGTMQPQGGMMGMPPQGATGMPPQGGFGVPPM
ncbi:MAG: type II secretion system protein GspG [Planctomycetaceae bacterium]|nr:type II secretion system protein GspG [Planctomycetaceae bacterium]